MCTLLVNFMLSVWVDEIIMQFASGLAPKTKQEKRKHTQGSWTVLVPVTAALVANSPSNLERGRSSTDLVTASQNKSRPFDKHRDKEEEVNIQRLCWLWVRDTKSQKKCDPGHMFDLCMLLITGLTLLQCVSYRFLTFWSSGMKQSLHSAC